MSLPLLLQIRAVGLPLPVEEHRFCKRRWRFDLAWIDRKLAVECEGGIWVGGRHVRGKGFERDCEKYSEAAILGWRVLRFTTGQIESGYALDAIERALEKDT